MITVNLYTSSLCCMFDCDDTIVAFCPLCPYYVINQRAPYFDSLFS